MEAAISVLASRPLLSLYLGLIFLFPGSGGAASPPPPFPRDALPTLSGYLPISPSSSMYYAYYEAREPAASLPLTPLIVWLQGGPGCSSMVGNFFELGPWLATNSSTGPPFLSPNPFSWNRLFGLLFLDNPIGTGFSVAASPEEIPRNQTAVSEHLWAALQRFFSAKPAFRPRPLYLAGESYAGKYVPSAGHYISSRNARARRRINLAGVAIGNGLTHPVAQVSTHADSAFYSGLINHAQKLHLENLQNHAVELTLEEKWGRATDARNEVLRSLQNMTGLATLYDLRKEKPYGTKLVGELLAAEEVRTALGVKKGAEWEECSGAVAAALHEDVMKSAKEAVEGLLRRGDVKVLLYQGLFDLRDGVLAAEAWVREITWEGLEGFLAAERKVWRRRGGGGKLMGYVQARGVLANVVVAGAGHLVPADQGMASQAMIEDWVLEKGIFGGGEGISEDVEDHGLELGFKQLEVDE